MLQSILPKLDRGGSPDSRFPDRKGEYWALCPFHSDKRPENFSVSEAGYHCFACGASGGLRALAEQVGVLPSRDAPRNAAAAGGVAVWQVLPLNHTATVPHLRRGIWQIAQR